MCSACLDGGSQCDDLVRVHALAGLAAEQLLYVRLHLGHTGHAAYKQHLHNQSNVQRQRQRTIMFVRSKRKTVQ